MTGLRKLAFVTPRYGAEVIGGAEYAARMMAENLVRYLDLEIEILTTTALDTGTWANHFDPGEENLNGVKVKRFSVDKGRSPEFSSFSGRLLKYPKSATNDEARIWIEMQGPLSSGLLKEIETSDAQAILFFPYLYHPMVGSIPKVSEKAVLIPAAHDEPPAYLPIFAPMFRSAKALMFQARAEERFVDKTFRVGDKPRLRAGLGIETYKFPITPLNRALPSLSGSPFLLTLGRVEQLKGATLLSELFAEFKRRNPSPLQLVFAGPVTTAPIEFPDIHTLGTVSEEVKWSLLNECTALVNPSAFESFSLVLFEAWSLRKPVMVNAQCEVTRDHLIDSAGGFAFTDFAEFEAQLNALVESSQVRDQLGANGRRYLDAHYRWEVIVEKVESFLSKLFTT